MNWLKNNISHIFVLAMLMMAFGLVLGSVVDNLSAQGWVVGR